MAEGWELDARDRSNLASACEVTDRINELEALVRSEGLVVRGSKGQDRLNPAISEIRLQRQAVAMLLGRVEVAPPAAKTGHLNSRQRAELRRLGVG